MPVYGYKAMDTGGKTYQAWITAPSEEEAKRQLRQTNVLVLQLWMQASAKVRLSQQQIAVLLHQLSILMSAGFPLYEALVSLKESESSSSMSILLMALADQIHAGATLAQSLKMFPHLFDPSLVAMIQAGEKGAHLASVLERTAKVMLAQVRIQKDLVTAMIYPALLALVSLAIVFLMLLFVVPSLEPLFEGAPTDSKLTSIVFAMSRFLVDYGFFMLFATLVFGTAAFVRYQKRKMSGISRDLSFLPLIGPIIQKSEIARFGFVMQALLESGVPLVDSLDIVRPLFKSPRFQQKLVKAKEQVLQGQTLSQALEDSGLPPLVLKLVRLGERSGSLALSFDHLRQMMDDELSKDLTRLTAAAQPIILVVMGAMVGLIMAAILIPLTDMGRLQGL
jgi:general secretion pathway protein F